MIEPIVLMPLRGFDGMSRLAELVTPDERAALVRTLATRMVAAARACAFEAAVITRDADVASWASRQGCEVIEDPGGGLDAAAAAGVAAASGRPWILAHADLPFVTPDALNAIRSTLSSAGVVLVPSIDGGTNVIAGHRSFPFSFGPGSFHRHLASEPTARVMPSAAMSIDIDTAPQFRAAGHLQRTMGSVGSLSTR